MSDKKNEKLSASRITQNVFWVLRRYLKYAPIATLVWALGIIFNRASWSCCSVIFSKILFDAIAAGEGFRRVVIAVLLFALIDSVATLWWHGARVCFNIGECKVLKKVERELYEKAISMDLACFEDPEFYNDYMMALDSTNEKMRATIYAFLDTVGNGFSLLGCIAIIGTISPVYVILPIVGGILGYFITLRDNRVNFEYLKGRKPAERRRDYYGRVFYLPEYAKEVRLSGATKLLLRRFSETMADLRKYDRGYALRQATLQFLKDFVVYDFIASIVMMGICIYQVLISKTVAVGGAAALVNAVEQTTYAVGHFSRNFAEFQNNAQYIECMRKFLDYEPKIVGGSLPAPEGPAEIRVEGLTFAYPGSETPVLNAVDLTIAPGERVALVGYNGAGKTTLVKLLLRLYDPTEGRILLNGHDLREYDITSLREYFGCVFQDFVLFAATLGENVACDFMENSDPEKIREALDLAGFSERLAKMEKGIDTPLTREFDENGLNLSGGENQKVAMARTFAKPSGCVILDEPSAALDPISEYNLNESMNAAAAGRTVFYISHRLSTTRMADRICMMEQGRIIESGSHDSLMALGGKYAQMFESQASRYIGSSSSAHA